MRRPPEVVQVGLLVLSLLGLSGCAGFPQRSSGTSLWGAPSDGEPAPPPGLFSWWHRPASQTAAPSSDSAGLAETSRPSAAPAVANRPYTDPWPESQSEWFARSFPRFNRLWNGNTAGSPRDGGDLTGRLQTSRTQANPPAADAPATASTPRSDLDVRPTDGASQDTAASSADGSGRRAQYPNDLPYSPTAPPVRSPRQSMPEPVSEPALDVTTPASAGQRSTQSDETDRAEPTSWQQDDPASAKRSPVAASGVISSPDQPAGAPHALEDILPAPLAGPQAALSTNGGDGAATEASAGTAGAAGLTSDPVRAPTSDSRLAQVPPAPAPVRRTPAAPAPAGGEPPASTPPEPPAAAAAAGSSPAAETGQAPTPASASPTAGSAAPAAAQSQAPPLGSVQKPLAASGQSIYASPPPMAPAQPRHHLLSWLFHDEPSGPLASSQLPPAAFPTTYSAPRNVQPTSQANAAGCDSPDKAPKKPCFLKVWIHDLKSCGHCSHGAGCGQGGVAASPQGNATECAAHAKAPKKPCFLKVWIHEWKNGHGSGCGGCQQGGATNCCQRCKCCGGGGTPVAASPQGAVASGQQGGTTGVGAQH